MLARTVSRAVRTGRLAQLAGMGQPGGLKLSPELVYLQTSQRSTGRRRVTFDLAASRRKSVAIMLPDYWLFDRIAEWLRDQHWLVDHIPEWLIALFTFTLWRSTRKLWIATRDTLRHTQGTTESLQRAYVSVQPGGIGNTTKGHLLAHVNFKNVGHLPASDFKWIIQELTPSDHDDWKPPLISDSDLG